MPSTGCIDLAPNEMYATVVTNVGLRVSDKVDDVCVSATFEENVTRDSICRRAQMTVCSFSVDAIKFNHDINAYTNDAINVRRDGVNGCGCSYDDGEWSSGGITNAPACYVGGVRPHVKVRFKSSPDDLLGVKMTAVSSDPIFGIACTNSVQFSEGYSQWCDFDMTNALPIMVHRGSVTWDWFVNEIQSFVMEPFWVDFTGAHTIYTILGHPFAPWKDALADTQCPWTIALDAVCEWAEGVVSEDAVMAVVTSNLFHNVGFRYDTASGAPSYWDGYEDNFDLSAYLRRERVTVNCYDQAYGVMILSNLLGANAFPIKTEPFGFVNAIRLIGIEGLCNNPFFTGDFAAYREVAVVAEGEEHYEMRTYIVPRNSLCEDADYIGRSAFGNHMFVVGDGLIFDACVGPELGTRSLAGYLNATVDHSTGDEQGYGCFAPSFDPYGFSVPNEMQPRDVTFDQREEN